LGVSHAPPHHHHTRVYVTNFPSSYNEQILLEALQPLGKVKRTTISKFRVCFERKEKEGRREKKGKDKKEGEERKKKKRNKKKERREKKKKRKKKEGEEKQNIFLKKKKKRVQM
jgi:hypothetical protein